MTPGERVGQMRDALLTLAGHLSRQGLSAQEAPRLAELVTWLTGRQCSFSSLTAAASELQLARALDHYSAEPVRTMLPESDDVASTLSFLEEFRYRAHVCRGEAEHLVLDLAMDSVRVGEARDLVESIGLSATAEGMASSRDTERN